MLIAKILIGFFVKNVVLFSFVAGFLSEDVLLFLIVFASANNIGVLYFLIVGFLGFIGILAHDSILYYLSNHHRINRIEKSLNLSKSYLISLINRFAGNNYFIPLVFSKFIYGIRTVAVILVSRKEKRFGSFLFYNSLATAVWLFVMLPVGYLTGKGFLFLSGNVKSLEHILAIGFIIIIVIYVVT